MFSDRRIRDALEAGRVGVWRWEIGADRLEWSPNLEAIHDMPPGSFDGSFAAFADDIHPEDRDAVMTVIGDALRNGGTYEVQYRLAPPRDGTGNGVDRGADPRLSRWVEARGTVEGEPGKPSVMTGICHDITLRKRVELELAERLEQQGAVAEIGRFALDTDDLQAVFDRACALLARTLRVAYAKILELTPDRGEFLLRAGVGWQEGIVGHATVGSGCDSQAGYTLQCNGPVVVDDLRAETRFRGPSLLHEHGVVSGMSTVLCGSNNSVFGVLGVHSTSHEEFTQYDVNFLQSMANTLGSTIQRIEAAEQQQFLFRELRHRVGNLFAQMSAIHRLSSRNSATIEELSANFGKRVAAAGEAHAVISSNGWAPTPFRTLLSALLRPYAAETELSGPDVTLPPDAAFSLGLAVNELATNAAKYGCFRHPDGRLSVRWRLQPENGRQLAVEWTEICPHPVSPPTPTRTSFGTGFIDTIVQGQMHGSLEREYAVDGLRLSMSFTLPEACPKAGA